MDSYDSLARLCSSLLKYRCRAGPINIMVEVKLRVVSSTGASSALSRVETQGTDLF